MKGVGRCVTFVLNATINNNGTIPIQLKGLGIWWGKLYANGQFRLNSAIVE